MLHSLCVCTCAILRVLDRKDPVCLMHLLTGKLRVTAVGLMWYLNYCAILNTSCTFAMLDNVAEWHLLRHHPLKDSVFEGGMNTNHKMGEEQVACVCLCVLHS